MKFDRNLRNFTLKWTKPNSAIISSTLQCIEKSSKCKQLPDRTTKTVSYRKLEENSNSRNRQLGANKKTKVKFFIRTSEFVLTLVYGNDFVSEEI